MEFEPPRGWSAFPGTDGAVWRYRERGSSGVVAITKVEGKRHYDATHNDRYGTGSSLATESRRKAAWFAMKGTLEGLPKPRKYARAVLNPLVPSLPA